MSLLLTVVEEFLNRDAWPYHKMEGVTAIQTTFEGKTGKWSCFIESLENIKQVVVYSVAAIKVPIDKRMTVAELMTRLNYGIRYGNFEMDFDDGEIRFRTSIDVEGTQLLLPMVKQLLHSNVALMDYYLPGILGVLYSNRTPESVINEFKEISF